jgi:hypothetical protein
MSQNPTCCCGSGTKSPNHGTQSINMQQGGRRSAGLVLGHKAGWAGCFATKIRGNLGGLHCGLGQNEEMNFGGLHCGVGN